MNKEQIRELIENINKISDDIQLNQIGNLYKEASLVLPTIQQFVLALLEYEIIEQQMALMLLTDLVQAIEQKDEVLLLDTLKYGINSLLCDILRVMEEEEYD